MTLMIGTTELAKRLYEAWRTRQDLVQPLTTNEYSGYYLNAKPRPKWEHVGSIEQGVWRNVAEEAADLLTKAMGAL